MSKLAAPYVARAGGRSLKGSASVFNEGVQVPKQDFAQLARDNPALVSTDKAERHEATRKSILSGALSKYRRR